MELFGYGNQIKINDTGYSFIQVKKDNEAVYVHALKVNDDTNNYADLASVYKSLKRQISNLKRELEFTEIKSQLIKEFGSQVRESESII